MKKNKKTNKEQDKEFIFSGLNDYELIFLKQGFDARLIQIKNIMFVSHNCNDKFLGLEYIILKELNIRISNYLDNYNMYEKTFQKKGFVYNFKEFNRKEAALIKRELL